MPRIAAGGGQFQTTQHHFAINLPQPQFQPPRAQRLPFQHPRQISAEIAQHLIEQRTVADRLKQAALDQRGFDCAHRQQRFGHFAQQLIEPDQRVRRRVAGVAEPPRHRIARHAGQVAHPLQPKTVQDQHRRRIKSQRRDGQVVEASSPLGGGGPAQLVEGHRRVLLSSLASTVGSTGWCPSPTTWAPSPEGEEV